ncbi:uncharacterized protein LOC135155674 isoform X2 [Lytechinus pictus]|uniref:uncharacterized protein LOC135155674 isoform X2 n=1 Tax=Lytechinus pictus TaxID=7653 RepID=UPI0030B9FFB7
MPNTVNITITCTARHYFPNVDLFFLHGSQKYGTKDTKEWINSDGTKSKSISTEAKPSSTPYTCVAFNIPGSQDQRTATVYVMSPNANTTSSSTIPPINISIVKIVVPILVVACFAAVIMVVVHRRKRRERTGNAEWSRKISFYELWCLVSWNHLLEEADAVKLLGTLNIDSTKGLSKHQIYSKLCTWKDMIDSSNEAESLENALKNAFDPDMEKYQRIWKRLCENRKDTSKLMTKENFEHIFWHINDRGRVEDFLAELNPGHVSSSVFSDEVTMGVAVQSAVNDLMEWSNGPLKANPFVLLSLALEKTKCGSVDRTFFIIPDKLIEPFSPNPVRGITEKLIRRHCMRLTKGDIKVYQIDGIEQDTNIFDIFTMIMDWINEQECSNYEKRCRLDDAFIRIGRYDLQDSFGTITYRRNEGTLQEHPHPKAEQFDHGSLYDDDIIQFMEYVKYLPLKKKEEFYDRIKFDYNEDGSHDKSCLVEKLKEFRDTILQNRTENEALQEFTSLRQETIKNTMYSDNCVTDEEIEDIDKLVIATATVEEFLKKVDRIEVGREQSSINKVLKDWRHFEYYIKFTAELRDKLRKILGELCFDECIVGKTAQKSVNQVELADVAFNLVMKDVLPLIKELSLKQQKVQEYIVVKPKPVEKGGIFCLVLQLMEREYTGIMGMERDRTDFCKALNDAGLIDVARSVCLEYELSLTELINIATYIGNDKMDCFLKHLGFKEEELKGCLDEEGDIDRVKTMVLWKHHIYPVPYPYRNKLVAALMAAEQGELANEVLSGRRQSKKPNPVALHNIFCRLNEEMISKLAGLLQVGTPGNRDIKYTISLLINWVTEWMDKFDPNDTSFLSNPMKERKKVNDMLFTNGFYELAKEIMLLERCHQHSSFLFSNS